jgi:hypothetical protein
MARGNTGRRSMAEKKEKSTDVSQSNPGHRFEPGHPRFSGRGKRTAAQARALAQEMGIDPLQFLMEIIRSDSIEQTVVENGKKKRITVPIPLDMRVEAAKHVSRFCYPVLSATQVTGAGDGPVAVAQLDVTAILQNPELAKAAQDLALMMVEQERLENGLPEPRLIDAPEYR